MDYKKEFGNDAAKKWFYMPITPKAGEPPTETTIKVVKIRKKIDGTPKYNFTKTEKITLPDGSIAEKKIDMGYQMEIDCADGRVLSISSLAAFLSTFVKYNIQEGETVTIRHIEKGKWEVDRVVEI